MAKKTPFTIIMSGDGRMEWKFPEDGNLQRFEAYEVLGMIRYAENALLKMLEQPVQPDKK